MESFEINKITIGLLWPKYQVQGLGLLNHDRPHVTLLGKMSKLVKTRQNRPNLPRYSCDKFYKLLKSRTNLKQSLAHCTIVQSFSKLRLNLLKIS